jgi:hypothetical protein
MVLNGMRVDGINPASFPKKAKEYIKKIRNT